MAPTFLTLAEVLDIHQDQIELYGGESGIRDLGLLKSAVGMPAATYGGHFLHADLHEMGAAYLYHLSQNHPFVDGNKRVAAVAAVVFFELNGLEVEADEDDFESMVFKVARGDMPKSEIAAFFRTHTERG